MDTLHALWDRIADEPVLVTTFVGALIDLGIVFGIHISDEQKVAIIAVVSAVLAFVARQQVTPMRKLATGG